MAAALGSESTDLNDDPLMQALARTPQRFEFFQAVRLLERLLADREPVGEFAHPSREVARFSATPSLAFPASQIQSLEEKSGQSHMMVNFMGLFGPLGVLPHPYTELVIAREGARDHVLKTFLDIFHHRLISLFYKAWEKYRHPVAYEFGRSDQFSRHLLDLIGLGTQGLQNRLAVPDEALMFYAGLFARQTRSETALRHLLMDFFEVPVEIEQFVGTWRTLEEDTYTVLEECNTDSERLGFGAMAGDAVWDQQSRVRIRLGPLPESRYHDFLPTGRAWKPLCAMTRLFAGEHIEFEVQLVLKRQEVPLPELGREGEGPLLGWTSWLKSGFFLDRDPGDTVLLLEEEG